MADERDGHAYIFLLVLSLMLTMVCLLVGFYLDIVLVTAMGSIYGLMTVVGLVIWASGRMLPEGHHLLAFAASFAGLSVVAVIFKVFTGSFRIIGVLEITAWPTQLAEQQPLTIGIGSLAISLKLTPQLLTTCLLQIPTGVGEESFFRVLLLNTLPPVMGKNNAKIASAISFGIMHYLSYSLLAPAIVTAIISGFILAVVYAETGSALGVILAHIVWNLLALLVGV